MYKKDYVFGDCLIVKETKGLIITITFLLVFLTIYTHIQILRGENTFPNYGFDFESGFEIILLYVLPLFLIYYILFTPNKVIFQIDHHGISISGKNPTLIKWEDISSYSYWEKSANYGNIKILNIQTFSSNSKNPIGLLVSDAEQSLDEISEAIKYFSNETALYTRHEKFY